MAACELLGELNFANGVILFGICVDFGPLMSHGVEVHFYSDFVVILFQKLSRDYQVELWLIAVSIELELSLKSGVVFHLVLCEGDRSGNFSVNFC